MQLSILKLFSTLFLCSIFGITGYNWKLNSLKKQHEENNVTFLETIKDVRDTPYYSIDKSIHVLNNVVFRLHNFSITDNTQIETCDSLINSITFNPEEGDSLNQSYFLNQNCYLRFIKTHKSHLLTQKSTLDEEQLIELENIISELKEAIRLNSKNVYAIHNYSILLKIYNESDFYYQKSKSLSDLIFKQLDYDMTRDSTSQIAFSKKMFHQSTKEKLETIPNEYDKQICRNEIEDSLSKWVNNTFRNDYQNKTIDSLRQYENIDLELIHKLKEQESAEKIITDFYSNKYPNLLKKTAVEHQKKILKDKNIKEQLQKILCKYIDCKDAENPKESKDSKEQQESNDQKKPQDKKSAQDSENQQKSMDDYKDSKETDENSKNKNSEEMKKKLEDYEEKREKKQASTSKKEISDANKSPSKQSTKGANPNSIDKDKLKEYNITEEQALEALKQIQEESDNYLKNKKQGKQSQTYDGDKPDW